jgi:excisionase family DNA binding protein
MSTIMERRVFSLDESAHYLDCGLSTIYKLINAGELRSVRIGRRHGVLRDDLDAFLDEQASKAPTIGTSRIK